MPLAQPPPPPPPAVHHYELNLPKLYRFHIKHFSIKHYLKIPRRVSEATTSYNSNVLIFMLLLSKGRAGKPCDPSNKEMLFLTPPH